jgi:lipopolysaccharide transport system ATP-binding protein
MSRIVLERASVVYPVMNYQASSLLGKMQELATGGRIRHADSAHLTVCALNNISLDIHEGTRLGILGRNGAGKTTLLRLITGVYPPVSGRIRVEGRVSSLIDIQLGLSSHLSGYENIQLRSLYMGIDNQTIRAQLGRIAEFTELGDYLHLPLRTYSSGMRLRLAFAIATGYQPDILIMDEWLSAGDEEFREKAQERLLEIVDNSRIFVMATHNRPLHRKLCTKGLVLGKGESKFFGDIEEAIVRTRPKGFDVHDKSTWQPN